MIKSLTVTNPLGASKKMVLTDPESSGILIANISGLGAEEAQIYTTDLASIDGAIFNSSRLPQRDITMTLMPISNAEGSVEWHRLEMYKYFPIKQKIKMVFETENRLAEIEGYVATNQPEIFEQQTSISITVTCPDPYFYDIKQYQGITTKIFTSVYKSFQFRYKNDVSDILPRVVEMYNAKHAIGMPSTLDTAPTDTRVWYVEQNAPQLSNNDIILFIPKQSAGNSKTYIKFYSNVQYEVLTAEGADFTSSYDFGRFSDSNDEDDILILKYSDNRMYVQGSFNKEDHLDWWKKTKFGEYASQIEQLLKYEGDVQLGCLFTIDIFGDLRNFSIVNIDERASFQFDDEKVNALTGSYFKSGDQIELSTVKGNKYVILKRDGVSTSLLNCINRDATWFQLNVGDNVYTYLANDTSVVSLTVKYKTALIGI